MRTHSGKIAQLPRAIRDELNERLERSEPGPDLLEWVNALPEVKELVEDCFDGVPVSKQNLSDWRKGGHQEWRLRAQLVDYPEDVPNLAADLAQGPDGNGLFPGLAQVLAARIAAVLYQCDGELTEEMKASVHLYKSLSMAVVRLQRSALQVVREEWEMERKREEWERETEGRMQGKMMGTLVGALQQGELSKAFGGGTIGSKIATTLSKVMVGDYENLPKIKPTDTFAPRRQKPKKAAENAETPEKSPPVKTGKGCLTPDGLTKNKDMSDRSHSSDSADLDGTGPPNADK